MNWFPDVTQAKVRSWLKSCLAFMVGLAIVSWGSTAFSWSMPTDGLQLKHDPGSNTELAQAGKRDVPFQVHPLPPTLAQWQDKQASGDYFDQIQPVNVGYLVWSDFPVKVFVEPVETNPPNAFTAQRSQGWVKAVLQAIQEWNAYLPLTVVNQAEEADIIIWRSTPPLRLSSEPSNSSQPTPSPRFQIRARNAETRYEIYVKRTPAETKAATAIALAHRFTIYLRPDQPLAYTLATARHELGHALGIWGHSLLPTDALYTTQVAQPPTISVRDVNTLKRVYEQPTRLGWQMSS
ncbi:hypothetical protein ACN4EK_08995 [Pantanalinema rosaneae CENA516]|uniref:hypothetical protein n=1 Tax=Pantanalinema rosaneae TaxID=1620701 RepID=UPI003D6E1EC9